MKLVHQVSLMLLTAVLLAVVAMGLLMAFNLERGFVDYINTRQLTHLDEIERRLTAEAARMGSLEHLRNDPRAWKNLLEGSVDGGAGRTSAPGGERGYGGRRPGEDRPPRRDGPPPGREFGDEPPPRDEFRKGPPREPRDGRPDAPKKGDPMSLGPRFFLHDADHRPMLETPPTPRDAAAPVERAIKVDGRIVAFIVHTPVAKAAGPEDSAFLRRQFKDIGIAALVLMVLALLAAPFVARRWTRPINDISAATARIAKGEFAVRLPDDRGDEIGTLMKNVNGMAQSLSDLEQARKRWIAESAHELRTPLAVLRGEIEALQDGVRPFDAKSLNSLGDEAKHLTKLVNDLHLLSLADMGALPCIMTRINLVELARRVGDRFVARTAQRGLTMTLSMPAGTVELEADDDRLEQLLNNLLENSLRYTDAPGRIELKIVTERNEVHLTVEDSAPSVDAAECKRLFEPLYRADKARSRAAGGSGLGLAICRAIMQAHGGKIFARPSSIGGLAITAVFPLT